jgi:hypothetical protein
MMGIGIKIEKTTHNTQHSAQRGARWVWRVRVLACGVGVALIANSNTVLKLHLAVAEPVSSKLGSRIFDPVRANQTRLPALLPLEFC